MDPAGIQRSLGGSWQLMNGRPEGLKALDLSADGFWNSFAALLLAFPARLLAWIELAQLVGGEAGESSRASLILRFALTDLAVWIVPLFAFAFLARRFGLADRFVPYVVATNWASALLVWLLLPPTLLRLLVPAAGAGADLLALVLFAISMVLTWRLTNAVIGKGAAVATGVFAGMFALSIAVLMVFQTMLAIPA